MQTIYEHIKELKHVQGLSKHEQFIQGFINAINNKRFVEGEQLPSINSLVSKLGFARETVAKGYRELINQGIVISKNRIGFFLGSIERPVEIKVALVLFAFDSYQEIFYKTLRNKLGNKAHIDIFFHHNNIDIFNTIIENVRGRYNKYVIAPIPDNRTKGILTPFPKEKLLIIDRFVNTGRDISHITQEFFDSSYRVFSNLYEVIKGYNKMVYYHRPNADTPEEILKAFKKFVLEFGINHEILPEYLPGSIKKGNVYFTINNAELWMMVKDAKNKKLNLGKDIGILSHNDDLVKEIILDGITTYSTSFELMAEKAAEYIIKGEKIQETIPTVLIRRGSL